MINKIYYEGTFSKGKKHGIGEMVDEDGNTKKGIWKNNELEEEFDLGNDDDENAYDDEDEEEEDEE